MKKICCLVHTFGPRTNGLGLPSVYDTFPDIYSGSQGRTRVSFSTTRSPQTRGVSFRVTPTCSATTDDGYRLEYHLRTVSEVKDATALVIGLSRLPSLTGRQPTWPVSFSVGQVCCEPIARSRRKRLEGPRLPLCSLIGSVAIRSNSVRSCGDCMLPSLNHTLYLPTASSAPE